MTDVPKGYRIPKHVYVAGLTLPTDVVQARRKFFSAASRPLLPGLRLRVRNGRRGTLGGFVVDQAQRRYLLSCCHVLTDFGRSVTVGQPIEDAESGKVLARLSRFVHLIPGADNAVDAALAELSATLEPNTPAGVVPGAGRVAEATPLRLLGHDDARAGTVSRLGVTEKVFGWGDAHYEYCWLTDQIEVRGLGEPGDSGALAVDDTGRAVGLFVADNGSLDLVTPVDRVLSAVADPGGCVTAREDSALLQLRWL